MDTEPNENETTITKVSNVGGEHSMFRLGQSGWVLLIVVSVMTLTAGLLVVLTTKFVFPVGTADIFFYISLGVMVIALAGFAAAFWIRAKLNAENNAYHKVADRMNHDVT